MTEDINNGTRDPGPDIPNNLSEQLASGKQRTRTDELFSAFSHQKRRLILYYLKKHGQATINELAIWIAIIDTNKNKNDVSTEKQEEIATDLFHIHLPKLADLKVIEYDNRSGDIRYRNPPKSTEQLLQNALLMDFE